MQEAPKSREKDTDGSPHHNDAMTSALVAELSWVHYCSHGIIMMR